MYKETCPFCNRYLKDFDFFEDYGLDQIVSFIAFESPNFLVKPDILPGVKTGLHFLLYPKDHIYNLAEVNHIEEMGSVLRKMEKKFGKMAIFEHGGLEEGNSNQSKYHAHAHIIFGLDKYNMIDYMGDMLDGRLPPDRRQYEYQEIQTPKYAFPLNIREHFQNQPYLYVQQGRKGIILSGKTTSMISQRAVHLLTDGEIMNWKEIEDRPDLQKQSILRILNLIKRCRE